MNDTQTPIKYTANDIADRAWDNSDDDYLAFLKMKNYALSVEAELATAREELETERIRLAACGVVAMADTKESRIKAREILPEYRSASLGDVERRVDECIELKEQRDRLAELLPCECIYDSTSPDPTQTCPKCRVLQSLNQPER